MVRPDVSFVITVYNKENDLPAMIHSIMRQLENITYEFIFVDDASTDNSIAVIEKELEESNNFTILKNKDNYGPSIRLNQGCAAASGTHLFLMDGDDILAKGALKIMLGYLRKNKADFVFGSSKVVARAQRSLLDIELPDSTLAQISTTPLDSVLTGRYVRMSYLVTKKLYLESGQKYGVANERIFIQDESLPITLAYRAKKMVTLSAPAVYSAKSESSLSVNKFQQIHDRFYAYYYALLEFKDLSNRQKNLIYKRAISSVWKAKKISSHLIDRLFIITYLTSRLFPSTLKSAKNLEQYRKFIDGLQNVRKIH